MKGIILHKGAELPDLKFWLLDDDGALINLASGYTFSFKLGPPGAAATFTKTTGITGAAGSGTELSGTPNLTVSFAADELDSVSKGATTGQILATTGGRTRPYQFPVTVKQLVT